MPTFRSTLPKTDIPRGFSLRRCPAQATVRACITCETLLVCDTHYWGGRTIPCERELSDAGRTIDDSRCPACRAMQPWRTHVYVSCFEAKTRDHFIFECTDAAAKPLEEYYTANKSLRGCIFNAYRPKGASNAKVLIVTSPGDLTKINLPAAPDLVAALAVIWRLPRTAMANTGESAGRPAIAFDAKVLKSLHEPPDNEGDPIEFERHRSAMIAELTANPKPNGRTKRKC